MSETSMVRDLVMPYITPGMNGIDLGFGGDPITRTAIAMDLPQKYSNVGSEPQHLYGDAKNLYWFRDGVLDYVYSSHLLEDFRDTKAVLVEWLRVLKPGGLLFLCLPDEQLYRKSCDKYGVRYNEHHECLEMGEPYMRQVFQDMGIEFVFSHQCSTPEDNPHYTFLIVGRKV